MSTLFEAAYSLHELLERGGQQCATPQGCRVRSYTDEDGEHVELSTQPALSIAPDHSSNRGRQWPSR